jgi:hypothetical protein
MRSTGTSIPRWARCGEHRGAAHGEERRQPFLAAAGPGLRQQLRPDAGGVADRYGERRGHPRTFALLGISCIR